MTTSREHFHPLCSVGSRPGPWLAHPAALARIPGPYAQGTLALTYCLPSGISAEPRTPLLTLVHDSSRPTPGPDPKPWASRFLQAVVEVVSSDRPLTQLARWTDSKVYDDIARIQRSTATRRRQLTGRPARQYIATVHVCRPDPAVAEVAARVTGGRRSRAVAARLDYERERWTCTALHFV